MKSAGFDVGHTRPSVEPERAELPVPETAHPDDRAFVVVRGKELAQVGDEQIEDAVLVEVDRRHVIGMRRRGQDRQVPDGSVGFALSTRPTRISVASISMWPSPSKSPSLTFDTAG